MNMNRRSALGLLAVGGGAMAFGGYTWSRQSPLAKPRPLAIPPLLEGSLKDGVRHYDLEMGRHNTEFFPGVKTPTFGINGPYLGPTLRMQAGKAVQLNVTNTIGDTTTLHWHGMHLPAKADGGPHQVIADGGTWQPGFEIKQRAATLWYHSHKMSQTGFQVYHGLAGMIIVDDADTARLDLPNTYGVDDIPLVLQDRRFAPTGAFEYVSSMPDRMMGMVGNVLLVNGTPNPYFEAKTNTVRLRLLNGSNARIYRLSFADGRAFHQIASDGGLLRAPLKTQGLTLAPAERAEIIVDVSDGRPATLVSDTPDTGTMMGGGMMRMMRGEVAQFKVLEIRPGENRTPAVKLPTTLATIDAPDPSKAVKTRQFVLEMGMGMGMMMSRGGAMTINGRSMDINRIDEVVKVGTSEVWQIENPSPLAHPFHIHDVQFQVIHRNGRPPAASEQGFKDTVLVHPGERVRLLLNFADYSDAQSPYMFHCHILEHEDAGMMGQFTVV